MRRAGDTMKYQLLSFYLVISLLLTGCTAAKTDGYLISEVEGSREYNLILNTYLSGYKIGKSKDGLYAELADGNAVVCFDVQAIPAMKRGVGRYWYPHILSTMVLAVDRSQTDAVVSGWNSLRENGISVGMRSDSVIRNMMAIGALSYGLNGKSPKKQNALDLLEYLYQNGKFELNNSDAPILICMDYEAAAWNRNGENYEIVVPVEGTLSYQLGLLSEVPLTLDQGLDDALLSAGLPLISGDKPYGFPDNYQSSYILEEGDYDWFLGLTENSSRDLRRKVFHSRLFTTADLREHILFAMLLIVAILLWKGTVFHRISRRDVCRVVDLMCWLMVGWILLRLLKYQMFSETFWCRMCWYGYYIFQLALPVTLLYLTVILDRPEEERRWRILLCFSYVSYLLSVLLVMTNDLHQVVFRFDPEGNWNSDYSYGLGYWIILGISSLFCILAVGKLFCRGQKNCGRSRKIFPLLFCISLALYITAYICRIPFAWESDITVCICIISVLFFETVLSSGLVPINVQYKKLFITAPIGLTLLDEKGHTVLSSRGASSISDSIWKRLLMDMEHPLLRDNDTQLHAVSIHGGMAVWQENLSELNLIRQEIQNVQTRLGAANALLQEEEEVKKRLLTAETNRNLFEHLYHDLEHRIVSLVQMIENLQESESSRDLTAYITLCLCHIKRRCNLFFLARQGESLFGDELNIYLDELCEMAGYSGMQTLIRCGECGTLEIRSATLCYDFAFETISNALKTDSSPLMGYLEHENNHLVFRFLPSGNPRQWNYSKELIMAISALNGQIDCKDLDDIVGICMTLPLGGEANG